jgi:hypothetical protein
MKNKKFSSFLACINSEKKWVNILTLLDTLINIKIKLFILKRSNQWCYEN